MTPCHCGRPGLYAGACYRHAAGFTKQRSKAAKKTVKTIRRRYGRHQFDPIRFCRKGLHRMTEKNTLTDSRGKRCRMCKQLSNQRSIDGLAKPCIRTTVLHHVPRQAPLIPRRHQSWEVRALEEAKTEFQAWLAGKDMVDLAGLAPLPEQAVA